MIISHKHKFIFLKTFKTAGTSLEIALSKLCGEGDILSEIISSDELTRTKHSNIAAQNYLKSINEYSIKDFLRIIKYRKKARKYFNHMNAYQIKQAIGDNIWESYYKFTVVRNPFEQLVSMYYWTTRNEKLAPSLSEWLIKNELALQNEWSNWNIYTINNEVSVDCFVEYENLHKTLQPVSDNLGIDLFREMKGIKTKQGLNKHRDIELKLSDNDIDIIKKVSKNEINLFNYEY